MSKYQIIEQIWKSNEKRWQFVRVVGVYRSERQANKALLEEIPKAHYGRDLAVVPREPETEGESLGGI